MSWLRRGGESGAAPDERAQTPSELTFEYLPLEALSRISPMRYAVDLTRGAFYAGRAESDLVVLGPLALNVVVMGVLFVVFLVAGTALFVRNERNR